MINKKQNIETLFKDNLQDYSINPNTSVWKKINRALILKKLFKFNPTTFNIYYIFIIGVLSTVTIYNLTNKTLIEKQNKKNKIEKNISNSLNHKNTLDINKIDLHKTEIRTGNKLLTNNNVLTNNKIYKEKKNKNLVNDIVVNKNITKENVDSELEKNNNSKLAKPSADFSASTYSACEPATIVFTNTSENCNSFLWNFGNEASSKETNPTFVFKSAGKYTVSLTVYSGGISAIITKEINVLPKPKSDFLISEKNKIFMNDEVKFANISTNFNSCKWDFGDENTSSFIHPSHIYEQAGLYDISLICFSKDNCSDTSKTETLIVKDDKYKIYAPTAISPDIYGQSSGYIQKGVGSNSVFSPIFNIAPAEYYLRIFNKFGSIVFESKDINYGWNGYYNNKPAPFDVYIWECTGKYADGKTFIKTGNLTLLYLENQ